MHILIVEDEPAIRQELKLLLENALYQVTALEEFENVAAKALQIDPDLVLLDVNLPGEAGFDVCTKIRSASEIPIIFVTSRTDSMDEPDRPDEGRGRLHYKAVPGSDPACTHCDSVKAHRA